MVRKRRGIDAHMMRYMELANRITELEHDRANTPVRGIAYTWIASFVLMTLSLGGIYAIYLVEPTACDVTACGLQTIIGAGILILFMVFCGLMLLFSVIAFLVATWDICQSEIMELFGEGYI